MAKLRRPTMSLRGISHSPTRQPARLRWLVIAGAVILGLLGLAWMNGGEQPLRPIAEQIELPEQSQ